MSEYAGHGALPRDCPHNQTTRDLTVATLNAIGCLLRRDAVPALPIDYCIINATLKVKKGGDRIA